MTETAAVRPRLRLPRLPTWMKVVFALGAVSGVALGVFGGLTFTTYRQPSGSMWPTLGVGDRLVVNRRSTDPERGAVVVFRYPEHPDQSFVKRVVGRPGDVVAMENGEVVINGWKVPRCAVGTIAYVEGDATGDSAKLDGRLYVEFLGSASYLVFEGDTGPVRPGDGERWNVANGEYFVLGDHRTASHDSRLWFGGKGGGVPFANTQGRLRGHEIPALPPSAAGRQDLATALAGCLAKRPAETSPPPPHG